MKRWGLLLALLLAACGQGEDSPSQIAMQKWVGKDFSNVVVQTLDGGAQPLKDVVIEHKPVILNVWATWCPPCLVEMPTLDALGKRGDYVVVAIATDREAGTVKDFLKKQGWGQGLRIWFDSLGEVTREQVGAIGLPVTYVLDPSLTVRMVEAGERDWDHASMRTKVEKALRK